MNEEYLNELIHRIKENRRKTPIQKVQPYLDRCYHYTGVHQGNISKDRYGKEYIFACQDCGFSNILYSIKNIETVYVCGRCNSLNVAKSDKEKIDKLNKIVSDRLSNK